MLKSYWAAGPEYGALCYLGERDGDIKLLKMGEERRGGGGGDEGGMFHTNGVLGPGAGSCVDHHGDDVLIPHTGRKCQDVLT
jgi:hypothetical protein